ncbi:hypothetical protein B0H19DRAFT_1193253 [Mycena capillaripes]|nr:hypothetical protein B0H19DRAFT_1193253 [Mycena capillaripes]
MLALPPLVWAALTFGAFAAVAQQPSAFWRKPNITISPTDRLTIAGAAIEKGLNGLGTDGQFTGEGYIIAGNFYYQMADFDVLSKGTQYHDVLQQYFPLAQTGRANFSDPLVHFGLSYGYAAARAYAAYKDPAFLQYAIESWSFGRSFTLSQANVGAGKIGVKNFTVSAVCQGATMVGGTFYSTDIADTAINGLSTGYFAVLSALLAEATSDPTYLLAAQQSAAFLLAHLVNTQNIVADGISGRSNECTVSSILEPYNSGLTIESIATVASVAQDASLQTALSTLIQAAVISTAWQGSNGIVSNTGHGGGGDIYLVRGLNVAYARNQTSPSLHTYIQDYLGVQFNAILDLSTSGGTDIYGGTWVGPPSASFSGGSQTLALSGLLAGISLHNDTDATTSSSASGASSVSATASQSPSSTLAASGGSHHAPIGAIVGGILGALIFLVGCIVLFLFLRRRRANSDPYADEKSYAPSTYSEPPTMATTGSTVRPFFAPSPPSSSGASPSPPPTTAGFAGLGARPMTPQDFTDGKRARYLGVSSPTSESSASGPSFATLPLGGVEFAPTQDMAPPGLEPQDRPARTASAMPTQELVRLLNQRLQNQTWDEEEAPPGYPTMSNER